MAGQDKQNLKNEINQQAEQIGDPNASKSQKQADKSKIDQEVKQVEQGEGNQARKHESYHVLGEIRKGEMEHGEVFKNTGSGGNTSNDSNDSTKH